MKNSETVRIQYLTADGIKQYSRMPKSVLRQREIQRIKLKIAVLDGIERPIDKTVVCEKRKYVLWTQLKNGTFVFREDS